jgi:hypothetical protein
VSPSTPDADAQHTQRSARLLQAVDQFQAALSASDAASRQSPSPDNHTALTNDAISALPRVLDPDAIYMLDCFVQRVIKPRIKYFAEPAQQLQQ